MAKKGLDQDFNMMTWQTKKVSKRQELNKNIIMSSFKSSGDIQRKRMGQTAVSDNQASSVTLNQLVNKARKIYCNFEFQRRSHTMTEINLNRAQITKTV